MQQYFLNQTMQIHDRIELHQDQAHHIKHVMRMKPMQRIRIADHEGHMFYAHVEYQGNAVFAYIDESIPDHTRNRVSITLAQGLIKKEKWDFLLQKSAELGVDRLLPFTSSRTVVKTKDEKQEKKQERWNKILLEACEQCKRSTLVDLKEPIAFADLISASASADVKLIAYENADAQSEHIKNVLARSPQANEIFAVVGCEGGFSLEEVQELEQAGFQRVSLGGRILRAETAAMVMLHSICFYYEMTGEDV